MEAVWAVIVLAFYILPFWFLFRAVRALERIADKIERTTDSENTGE